MSESQVTICKVSHGEIACKQACPAGIDVPRYIRLVTGGNFAEAVAVIREKVPFPATLGHVCPHFCEEKCRRGEVDQPVAINALKRAATEQDTGLWKQNSKLAPPTGKKVAIVGSGPAGLTPGYYLAKLGHSVTVFEALPVAGGMMRVGIPEYRLPRKVLDKEIDEIKNVGVEIKTNTRVDSLNELLGQGYDAVLLAIGAHRGTRMEVEGEDSPGIVDGVTFLRDITLGKKVNLGDRVAVIGGGNVALDSARTALRLGARAVTIIYRRTRTEMPASHEEIEAAISEGVEIIFLAAPERITQRDGNLSLSCIRMEPGEPDTNGRPRPIPIKGSEFSMDFDSVIAAVGQTPDIPSQFDLKTGDGNTIKVDSDTLATNRQGVFAAGDVVTGPSYVIDAIASGRRAAISIDKYLGGNGDIEEVLIPPEEPAAQLAFDESILDKGRQPMSLLSKDERLTGFAEVELGFTKEAASEEASRCLRCDQQVLVIIDPDKCTECYRCQMICSLVYQGAFNPEKARVVIGLPEISWTEECIGGCALCIQRCLNKAITLK